MVGACHGIVRIVAVAAVIALPIENAPAAESSVGAYVGARAAYSDNLTLSADDAESGRVNEISTGISLDRVQPRIDTHVAYDVQGMFYDVSSSDQAYQQLDARADLALVPNRFFLDVFGVYDQTIVDPTGPISFNNLTLTGNREDVALVGLTPRVSLDIGESVTGELRFSRIRSNYETDNFRDSDESNAEFSLRNVDDRQGGTWALAYSSESFDYDSSPDVEFETLTLQLGYWVGSTTRFFATQGLESDYRFVFATTGDSPGLDEHYWNAGVEVQPNERANITLAVGDRSFGQTHSLNVAYETRRGNLAVAYSEEPSSFARDQARSAQQSGEIAPIDGLDGLSGNLFYLQKRWDASYALERAKSSFGFRFFDDRRFDILAAMNDVSTETESYRGTDVWLAWDFSVRWNVTANAQVAKRGSVIFSTVDELKYFGLNFGRQIGQKGLLSLLVSRESAKPLSGASANAYEENQVSIAFRRSYGAEAGGGVPSRYSGSGNGQRR